MADTLSYAQAMTYNRHIVLPQIDLSGQEALLNAQVLVIGMGGLGCPAAQLLCTSGVGKITLVDDDIVASSNLPRQWLYSHAQVGQYKVHAARDRLHALNPDCRISVISQRLNDEDLAALIQQHDMVLDCTDNPASRLQINAQCYQQQRVLVSAASIRFEGQLQVVDPRQQSPCYQCVSRLFSAQALSCNEAGIFAPVVSAIGTQQAHIALLMLMGIEVLPPGQLMTYDGLSLTWQSFSVPADPQCPVCQPQ
ncbi:HesA/MoeB/ThiF family protein [Alteromonas lipolytica]|uniref:Molybdopterin-synthase adenylyltransferase MoeB n=1 Tax=Alteromonas lipolytica TaxID=1856405 RepID=A0A1E8FHD9_9ALTE|nr:molybdopterin-synthase adenylyltransferase MoeB [Alteromonas lipolytica]OFI35350.1 molybdopterin-synthase adenylyltransferase MoeB [Alteromonas lipolytica]